MPISSGATGRVGAKDAIQGSYLKRYLGTLSREKRETLENSLEAENVTSAAGEDVGVSCKALQQKCTQERHQNSDGDATGKHAFEQTPSKKSSTCAVL